MLLMPRLISRVLEFNFLEVDSFLYGSTSDSGSIVHLLVGIVVARKGISRVSHWLGVCWTRWRFTLKTFKPENVSLISEGHLLSVFAYPKTIVNPVGIIYIPDN